MAKIGTAHIELKPVLNDDALSEIERRIEAAVRAGITAALAPTPPRHSRSPEDAAVLANVLRERTARYEQGVTQS